jgi:hypothetical protein
VALAKSNQNALEVIIVTCSRRGVFSISADLTTAYTLVAATSFALQQEHSICSVIFAPIITRFLTLPCQPRRENNSPISSFLDRSSTLALHLLGVLGRGSINLAPSRTKMSKHETYNSFILIITPRGRLVHKLQADDMQSPISYKVPLSSRNSHQDAC